MTSEEMRKNKELDRISTKRYGIETDSKSLRNFIIILISYTP